MVTQDTLRTQPLHSRKDATRHEGENLMAYREEMRPGYECEGEQTLEHVEYAGVVHLVHGWIQQGQKSKVNSTFITTAAIRH
jgi:hypothetical protein